MVPLPSAPLSGCPRLDTVVDFLRGRLSEAELESVTAHPDTTYHIYPMMKDIACLPCGLNADEGT